ncbi:MAG: hypothetical protein AB8I08_06230 [Sandaracinaceae bacterium]
MHVLFILFIPVAVFGAVFLFWYFSADQRAKRAIRAVALSRISEAGDGERVRVVGQIELEAPVTSPLSGRKCAYWRVLVEERRNSGKNNTWRTLIDEHDGVDFLLRDPTGLAVVEAMHVTAVLEKDGTGGSGFLRDPSPQLEAFLAERGHDTKGWFFNKTIRYYEGVAEPGELIAVVGVAKWERDPDASTRAGEGYREAHVPKRLRIRAPEDGTALLLSDQSDALS